MTPAEQVRAWLKYDGLANFAPRDAPHPAAGEVIQSAVSPDPESREGSDMNAPDEPPPRPPRTARPDRPPRRRLPWVLVGGALAVLVLVCVGLGVWQYHAGPSAPRWQSFDVPDGGCRADFPAEPSLQPAPTQPGVKNLTTYSARRLSPAQEFGVGYFDVPGEVGPRALEEGLTGAVRSVPGMTERTRGPATLGGLPGRQVVADGPGGTMVVRIAPAGNRVYVLSAVGASIGPDAAEAVEFFDSFQVTDEARLARARAREREATERRAEAERRQAEFQGRQEKERQEALARAEAARKEYERFEKAARLDRELPDGAALAGVKMYLPFRSDGGTEVRDARGRVLGAVKEPARFGDGARGTGLHLPAEYAVLYLPDTDGVQFEPDDPFTVAGWFRAREAKGDVLRIGPTGGGINSRDQLVVELRDRTVTAHLWAPKIDPKVPLPTQYAAVSAPWPGDDAWHHFALVRTPNDDGEVVEFYFDGVRAAQQFRDRRSDLYAARALTLGGYRHGQSLGPFRGAIDEVYTFSRALSEADVRRLAGLPAEAPPRPQATSPADLTGLVFHLPFDDTDGRQVTEAVTKKPVGRLKGSVEVIDGVRGRAARLAPPEGSGVSRTALVLADEKGKFEFAKGAPFTVATWLRAPSRQNAYVMSNFTFQFTLFEKSVSVTLHGQSQGMGLPAPSAALQAPRPDGWFHVALTRSAEGELTLYVNGAAAGQVGKAAKLPDAIRLAPGGEFGLVGSYWGRESCDLDEFCLYDRALTADEVKKLGAKPDGPAEKNGKPK